jgi:hypothetical protein
VSRRSRLPLGEAIATACWPLGCTGRNCASKGGLEQTIKPPSPPGARSTTRGTKRATAPWLEALRELLNSIGPESQNPNGSLGMPRAFSHSALKS